jgi:hypothetical protein
MFQVTRAREAALIATAVLPLVGCGSGSHSKPALSSAAAATSATASGVPSPAATTASVGTTAGLGTPASTPPPPAAPPPLGHLLLDPEYVPSAPSVESWYGRTDNVATPENEAAREIAREAAGNGVSETQLYEHLTQGGAFAIWVGGSGHERDSLTRRSGWMAPYARYVQATLGIPGIQVDYHDWTAGNDAKSLATYYLSFQRGVRLTLNLIEKARSAGVSEVRLYGQSKGGDIVQEVVWLKALDSLVVSGVCLGTPLWSAINQGSVHPTGYGGLFRLGVHGQRDYRGKVVLFVRASDRASRGELLPASTFPGPGHEYKHVLRTPGFPERLDEVRFKEPVGFADRAAGVTYDY